MKRRVGFVSNSSSSSFCLYGYYVQDDEDFLDRFKLTPEKEAKLLEASQAPKGASAKMAMEVIIEEAGIYELLDILDVPGIAAEEDVFLGVSYFNMGDNETGAEFKARSLKAVSEGFDVDGINPGFQIGEVYN
jgi:hypothetical protein